MNLICKLKRFMTTHQDLIDNLMCKFNGVQIGKATLFNCDCNDLMAHVPEKHFELACVDPPYGIGQSGGAARTRGSKRTNGEKKNWDTIRPDENYFFELQRVSKNQIIWGGNYFSDFLPSSRCWIYWQKDMGGDFADGELAYTSFDQVLKQFRLRSETFNRIHPTQKPIKLYEWLLTNYAKQGDKILDTHLGSGSHAIACNNLGFELTACELDKDYFEASIKRIEQASKQTSLFEPQQPVKPAQEALL